MSRILKNHFYADNLILIHNNGHSLNEVANEEVKYMAGTGLKLGALREVYNLGSTSPIVKLLEYI